jgi:uncharacterized protein
MTTLYQASVPVFQQMLTALSDVMNKAEAHAIEKKIDPSVLLQSRLYPDMFPLTRQVQIAADFAKSVPSRLAGIDVAAYDDNEQTFAELQTRIRHTLSILASITAPQVNGQESLEIVLRPNTPKEKKLSGEAYLLSYGLPQFFFHVTTAYAILRHNGVEVGKRDFMGAY